MRRARVLISTLLVAGLALTLRPAFGEEAVGAEHPLAAEARELLERVSQVGLRRSSFEDEAAAQQSESRRQILEEQAWQAQLELQTALQMLSENVLRQQQEGLDVSGLRVLLAEALASGWPGYRSRLERREARIESLVAQRDGSSGKELLVLETRLSEEAVRALRGYQVLTDATLAFAEAGIDVSEQRSFAERKLQEWAGRVGATVRVSQRRRDEVRSLLEEAPGDSDVRLQLEAAEQRLDRATDALSAFAAMMDRLDLETAPYRQLLFETTGELTADVLDEEVLLGLSDRWRRELVDSFEAHGPRWLVQAFVFLAILVAFRLLAAITRRIVSRSVSSGRIRVSQLLQDTLVSWSAKAVMAAGVLVALGQLGVQIGPLLAGLGIAGFVLGFALQDSLSNFAAGAMILLYRPYDVGDVIEAGGVQGKVDRMTLVSTTFLTFDNQTLIVPNSKIWGDVIRNVTAQQLRRVDLIFGIAYDADIEHAEAVLRDILAKNEAVLDSPEPMIRVHNLGDSSVDFAVRPWVRTVDYWETYWALTREVKLRFDAEGIGIPFPQRDVHVHVANAEST